MSTYMQYKTTITRCRICLTYTAGNFHINGKTSKSVVVEQSFGGRRAS
ncbi:MAG: hypothetical protein WDA24_01375 [Tissierellales bacterium]